MCKEDHAIKKGMVRRRMPGNEIDVTGSYLTSLKLC
jgi:hypothetical protein